MNLSIADLRQNYTLGGLLEEEAEPNPLKQFKVWLEQAIASQLPEPNAMSLSTVKDGKPVARMVLLKHFDERGFVFFTNYHSHKGEQLTNYPWAALVFWWVELERQVRIEGRVEKVTAQESDIYFYSRPKESQLGAWVSEQSQVIPNREVLERRFQELEQEYHDKIIPRPSHWGGFRLIPTQMEFWQGRPSRLHDRLRYQLLEDGSWLRDRLAP